MRLISRFLILSLTLLFVACNVSDDTTVKAEKFTFQFSEEPEGWTPVFSNYGVGREDEFKLRSGYRSLPAPLDTTESAFYLSGDNLSDDLNMMLKYQVSGLAPSATYIVAFEVTFATEAPSNCGGVGGAPGEAVTVHAATSPREPERLIDESTSMPYYRLNFVIDYEGQQNWYKISQLGDISNSRQCNENRQFELKHLESDLDHWTVETDSEGRAWIYFGTRSGFEATTSLYYTEIQALFRKE